VLLPQLSSSSAVQFQMRRSTTAYGASNQLASGSLILGENTRPLRRMWELSYGGLTNEELAELAEFCNSLDATVDGFVFLDPFNNMLNWSENLTTSSWVADPTLTVVEGAQSNFGEGRVHVLESTGSSEQSIRQEIELTGSGRFCASCLVRSDTPGIVGLRLNSATESSFAEFQSSSEWNQVYLSAAVSVAVPPLAFCVDIAPGSALQVKGLQLEYQPFPSRYKPTRGKGGVYANARVLYQSYQVVQHGPEWFDCSFQIEA
jgi:hypothetical protein